MASRRYEGRHAKAETKKAPPKKAGPSATTPGYTGKVNAATGRVTGYQTVKKANAASAKIKPVAPRGTHTTKAAPRPSPTPARGPLDELGSFLSDRIDTITGKKQTPISRAMKNRNSVQATQENLAKAKRAIGSKVRIKLP